MFRFAKGSLLATVGLISAYEEIERKLAAQLIIAIPAITSLARSNGNNRQAMVRRLRRRSAARTHRQIPDAGYNLPQEAPRALLDAVMKLMKAR